MFSKNKLSLILSGLAIFIIFPFITLLLPTRPRDYFCNDMSLQILYKKITENDSDDSSRVLSIYHFTTSTMNVPPKSLIPKTLFPFQLLLEGTAYCDQQSNIMLSLAEKGNIKGNLIFLNGFDSVSHHSVCEIIMGREYKMFDPLYKTTFLTPYGNIASIKNIQDSFIRYPESMDGLPYFYFRLYEKKFPYKICKSNELSSMRSLVAISIKLWLTMFDQTLLKTYYQLYFRTSPKYRSKEQIGMNLLF